MPLLAQYDSKHKSQHQKIAHGHPQRNLDAELDGHTPAPIELSQDVSNLLCTCLVTLAKYVEILPCDRVTSLCPSMTEPRKRRNDRSARYGWSDLRETPVH